MSGVVCLAGETGGSVGHPAALGDEGLLAIVERIAGILLVAGGLEAICLLGWPELGTAVALDQAEQLHCENARRE